MKIVSEYRFSGKTYFHTIASRSGFDIVAPFHEPTKERLGSIWNFTVDLFPLRRKYLVTFEGKWVGRSPDQNAIKLFKQLKNIDDSDDSHDSDTEDSTLIDHDCPNIDGSLRQYGLLDEEFLLCRNDGERSHLLKKSTFVLIMEPYMSHSSHHFQIRVHEALRYGAIPVIVGGTKSMPFSETLDWDRAALFFPMARLPELHFLLRTISDEDIFAYKRQGSMYWEVF